MARRAPTLLAGMGFMGVKEHEMHLERDIDRRLAAMGVEVKPLQQMQQPALRPTGMPYGSAEAPHAADHTCSMPSEWRISGVALAPLSSMMRISAVARAYERWQTQGAAWLVRYARERWRGGATVETRQSLAAATNSRRHLQRTYVQAE